jgi:hypothetical protein
VDRAGTDPGGAEDRGAEGRGRAEHRSLGLAARRRRGARAPNLRQRRADSRGAARFGIFMFLAYLAARLAAPRMPPSRATSSGRSWRRWRSRPSTAASAGCTTWQWSRSAGASGPTRLLGWTRLWSGRLRDPRVGRELLIGDDVRGAVALRRRGAEDAASPRAGSCRSSRSATPLWVTRHAAGLVSQWLGLRDRRASRARS